MMFLGMIYAKNMPYRNFLTMMIYIHIFNNRRNVIICNHNSESQQYKKHSDSQMVFFRSEKCPDPHFRFFNINQHFRRSSIRESKKDIHLDTAGKSLLTL